MMPQDIYSASPIYSTCSGMVQELRWRIAPQKMPRQDLKSFLHDKRILRWLPLPLLGWAGGATAKLQKYSQLNRVSMRLLFVAILGSILLGTLMATGNVRQELFPNCETTAKLLFPLHESDQESSAQSNIGVEAFVTAGAGESLAPKVLCRPFAFKYAAFKPIKPMLLEDYGAPGLHRLEEINEKAAADKPSNPLEIDLNAINSILKACL